MIPFRPTIDRVWESMHDLRRDHRDDDGYVIWMHPSLWADTVHELRRLPDVYGVVVLNTPTRRAIFGLPVEVNETMPRGWIAVRHEVVR